MLPLVSYTAGLGQHTDANVTPISVGASILSWLTCAAPCRPALTQDNVLDIRGGRHPLAEMAVAPSGSAYIPNDTHMAADKTRVHVVTGKRLARSPKQALPGRSNGSGHCLRVKLCYMRIGCSPSCKPLHVVLSCPSFAGPNASGKSCYAKQVALIVYMAHLG